jgi:hypothetical protein
LIAVAGNLDGVGRLKFPSLGSIPFVPAAKGMFEVQGTLERVEQWQTAGSHEEGLHLIGFAKTFQARALRSLFVNVYGFNLRDGDVRRGFIWHLRS